MTTRKKNPTEEQQIKNTDITADNIKSIELKINDEIRNILGSVFEGIIKAELNDLKQRIHNLESIIEEIRVGKNTSLTNDSKVEKMWQWITVFNTWFTGRNNYIISKTEEETLKEILS